MLQREFVRVPLSKLILTDINMRHDKKAPAIDDILPSIRERGILQTLLVRPKGKLYEIAAGRRRYFCLKAISGESGEDVEAPCLLLEDGDDVAAIEASLLENVARQDADEMTQYETYARLLAEGKAPADIARTFGIEQKTVEKRLALGKLDRAIRGLFRDEKISVEEIKALTLASSRQQKEWLKLHKAGKAPAHWKLKEWIIGGASISAEVALFDIAEYKGDFIADLFGEDKYFGDTAPFWELQNQAVAARRDKYLKKGWAGVEVLEKGASFQSWQYTRTAKKDGAKVIVEIGYDGSVKFHEGFLSNAQASRIKRAKGGEDVADLAPVTNKPELTQPQVAYVNAHRQSAARAALIQNPGVAFRLMIAHAISGSHNFRVTVDRNIATGEAVEGSVSSNKAHLVFSEAQATALGLLNLDAISAAEQAAYNLDALSSDDDSAEFDEDDEAPAAKQHASVSGHHGLTEAVFAKLLTLEDMEVMQIAAVVMAEALTAGSMAVEAVTLHTGANLAGQWQPDELFWDQLRDKEIIGQMLADVAGKAAADSKLSATGKVKKEAIQAALAKREDATWLPRWLEAEPKAYTDRGTFRSPDHYRRVTHLLAVK